ncbi:MAG: HupE/UreJ family protein, partial [Gammaproteobacteria bacterium]|nr:HupE/UreJ family protein [Gammaproteobacteria bacterium]
MIQRIIISCILLLITNITIADEIRPGYLEVNEESPGTYSVIWKVPVKPGRNLLLKTHFPDSCVNKTAITTRKINAAILQNWYIQCVDNIVGERIFIEGLDKDNTDVLLRLKWLDGSISTTLLKPSAPFYTVPETSSWFDIATTYLWLGTEHILLGFDHLLFVFALLLIVKNTRRLIVTITAFTLAHSITLAIATLGYVAVPQQPV